MEISAAYSALPKSKKKSYFQRKLLPATLALIVSSCTLTNGNLQNIVTNSDSLAASGFPVWQVHSPPTEKGLALTYSLGGEAIGVGFTDEECGLIRYRHLDASRKEILWVYSNLKP